jgi:LmbE family N-acetylglucosaminyl deacetylase
MRGGRILVLAAHPDDETIGCGALLARAAVAHVVHLTDGAPVDPALVPAEWRRDREAYRRARRREALCAVGLAGVPAAHVLCLGAVDQDASFAMASLGRRAADLLETLAPDVVIAHPYEGGHPDHDAAAFVARAAIGLVAARGGRCPELVEMTSYHAASGQLIRGAFIGGGGDRLRVVLSDPERSHKQRMLSCFETQRDQLADFSTAEECFRAAPRYDFSAPPHPGRLHYERLGWSMTGERWRELCDRAERELFGPAA